MSLAHLTRHPVTTVPIENRDSRRTRWLRRFFGFMFLAGGCIHVTLISLNRDAYAAFADGAYWPSIKHAWRSVLVPNAVPLILLLATFEFLVGATIVSSNRYWKVGVAAAIAFHGALMLFSFGIWLWTVPMLAMLFWLLANSDSSVSSPAATRSSGRHPRHNNQSRLQPGVGRGVHGTGPVRQVGKRHCVLLRSHPEPRGSSNVRFDRGIIGDSMTNASF